MIVYNNINILIHMISYDYYNHIYFSIAVGCIVISIIVSVTMQVANVIITVITTTAVVTVSMNVAVTLSISTGVSVADMRVDFLIGRPNPGDCISGLVWSCWCLVPPP